jgi:hypothetical protein
VSHGRYDAARLDEVQRALAAMESIASIVERLRVAWGKGAPVKRATVRRYVVEVHRRWAAEAASTTTDERRDRLAMMVVDLYREARHAKRDRVALECTRQLAQLYGVTVSQASATVYDTRNGVYTSGQAVTRALAELQRQQLAPGDGGDDGGDDDDN